MYLNFIRETHRLEEEEVGRQIRETGGMEECAPVLRSARIHCQLEETVRKCRVMVTPHFLLPQDSHRLLFGDARLVCYSCHREDL